VATIDHNYEKSRSSGRRLLVRLVPGGFWFTDTPAESCAAAPPRRVHSAALEGHAGRSRWIRRETASGTSCAAARWCKWGIAYSVAAWVFLQGLEYVSEAFGWPGQLRQVAILALLIGLPIVLVIAWYHGDRGAQRVSGVELTMITPGPSVAGGVPADCGVSDL